MRKTIFAVLTSMIMPLVIVSPAHAASTTTDYVWSSWVECDIIQPHHTLFGRVRWRIDYRHNSSGQRDARAITYVDYRDSDYIHREFVSQLWHSNGSVISSASRVTNAPSADWYVGSAMTWTGIRYAADVSIALSLTDVIETGNSCRIKHSY